MAIRYYDDILREKIQRWIPQNSPLRILKYDESKRFYNLHADDTKDKPFRLPLITISRSKDINLLSNIKQLKSFSGLSIAANKKTTVQMNVIPILPQYQLDIYTKTYEEGDEYVRSFLFKLINNPKIIVRIPYNGVNIEHIANIRVLDTVSDTSDISEHLFDGQFTRWTIQLEIHDAFLFSIPYKQNWSIVGADLEVTENLQEDGFIEKIADFDEIDESDDSED